ncbi:molybdopterin-guanine dinucleotide biosynthesis protein A (MobA) [Methanocaldococcus infernus ME]|uniref:Probable molybdenum cofactor guanylyltransferase n=1 Tax=Methanocaldococcus infernus (strain DSM 11812 / JCM 15783 / ME) TaxID=573063 RepID=D5VQT9_METIM|nr:molybdenum cofactor guanylyltransferase [Methanocaldococcus infernus]ADG12942.1 molybdopterin-guanine dinucleotide biosynthesis protein A (MobA) [Methanocaldococcus infernus ME]
MISAIILAGGKGKRIGGNKPFKKFGDKYLIDYPISILKKLKIPYTIVTSKNLLFKYNNFLSFDLIDDFGPLAGILSGMRTLNSEWYLVLPCDCPFLTEDFINYLIANIKFAEKRGCKCIVPRHRNGFIEPLFSLYRKDSKIYLNKLILEDKRKIIYLIRELNPLYVDAEKFKNVFININTPEELRDALKHLIKK